MGVAQHILGVAQMILPRIHFSPFLSNSYYLSHFLSYFTEDMNDLIRWRSSIGRWNCSRPRSTVYKVITEVFHDTGNNSFNDEHDSVSTLPVPVTGIT